MEILPDKTTEKKTDEIAFLLNKTIENETDEIEFLNVFFSMMEKEKERLEKLRRCKPYELHLLKGVPINDTHSQVELITSINVDTINNFIDIEIDDLQSECYLRLASDQDIALITIPLLSKQRRPEKYKEIKTETLKMTGNRSIKMRVNRKTGRVTVWYYCPCIVHVNSKRENIFRDPNHPKHKYYSKLIKMMSRIK